MPILTLRLPDVKPTPTSQPLSCPFCGWKRLQRWGSVWKRVRDSKLQHVTVQRYRCCRCHRT